MKKNKKKLNEEPKITILNDALKSLMIVISTLQAVKNMEVNGVENDAELNFPKEGIDFFEARKKYETRLVKKALNLTSGHQGNAARLLNMKKTTLNSIIKRNKIKIEKRILIKVSEGG